MEKRLCYCKSCASFYIITPDKVCPKCQGKLISSVITEEEWNRSNAEQKAAYKTSLSALGNAGGQGDHDFRKGNPSQNSAPFSKEKNPSQNKKSSTKEKARTQAGKTTGKSSGILGKLLLVLVVAVAAYFVLRPYDGACMDYESAGKKIYKQISEYDSDVDVVYHSDHFNRIIGINEDINNIMKEACKNNGDPREGDHLAMNATWIGGEYTAIKQKDGTNNLNIRLIMDYRTTKEQEEELKKRADSILAGFGLNGASDYQKVRAIYNYICSNVVYDYEHLDDDNYLLKHTAYAAALHGTAVCSGIADLFYYLATAAGLEARITINDVHAWNIVKVDGKYYYLDPTWDLGLSENEYRYFLRGSGDFVSILNGPEHAAHRPNLMAGLAWGPKHPLINVEQDYEISDKAYAINYPRGRFLPPN